MDEELLASMIAHCDRMIEETQALGAQIEFDFREGAEELGRLDRVMGHPPDSDYIQYPDYLRGYVNE